MPFFSGARRDFRVLPAVLRSCPAFPSHLSVFLGCFRYHFWFGCGLLLLNFNLWIAFLRQKLLFTRQIEKTCSHPLDKWLGTKFVSWLPKSKRLFSCLPPKISVCVKFLLHKSFCYAFASPSSLNFLLFLQSFTQFFHSWIHRNLSRLLFLRDERVFGCIYSTDFDNIRVTWPAFYRDFSWLGKPSAQSVF